VLQIGFNKMTTRKLGFSALLKAVYKRLMDDPLLCSGETLLFYNHVPANTAYPYHVIGKILGIKSVEFTTRDTEGEENAFQIDSWVDRTSGLGDKACADMQNNIIQRLTSSALSIDDYNAIYLYLDYGAIFLDPENPELGLRHGILRFRQEMSPV